MKLQYCTKKICGRSMAICAAKYIHKTLEHYSVVYLFLSFSFSHSPHALRRFAQHTNSVPTSSRFAVLAHSLSTPSVSIFVYLFHRKLIGRRHTTTQTPKFLESSDRETNGAHILVHIYIEHNMCNTAQQRNYNNNNNE